MDLSPINGCVVATTFIDQFGELHHREQRHSRVTRRSVKRLLQSELTEAPLGYAAISLCAAVTRTDDFLGIEVIRPEGAYQELSIVELQRSLLDRLRELGGGALRGPNVTSLETLPRPMTRTSHGTIVGLIEPTPEASPNAHYAFSTGRDALDRSLELSDIARQLGVQWTKSKMLDIRVDANPAYLEASLLR